MWVNKKTLMALLEAFLKQEMQWDQHLKQHSLEETAINKRLLGLETLADLEPARGLLFDSIIQTQKELQAAVAELQVRINALATEDVV